LAWANPTAAPLCCRPLLYGLSPADSLAPTSPPVSVFSARLESRPACLLVVVLCLRAPVKCLPSANLHLVPSPPYLLSCLTLQTSTENITSAALAAAARASSTTTPPPAPTAPPPAPPPIVRPGPPTFTTGLPARAGIGARSVSDVGACCGVDWIVRPGEEKGSSLEGLPQREPMV